MLTITPQQGRERYKVIPKELQDLIFAETTKELFDHVGEENHLDSAKTYELGRVAGLVLLGFLHHDDTRKELQEALAINPMVANELQNELNKKLFAPVTDLLEKIYSPLSKATLGGAKSLDSIVPNKPMSFENMPKPAPMPSIPPASFPTAKVPEIPTAPAPTNTPSTVPAKISPLTLTKTPSLAPTPTEIPKPMVFVTQTGGQSAPVGNVPKFKLETAGSLTGSAFGGSSAPTFGSAPRPAKIELGFSPTERKPVSPSSFTFETQKSSVRYGAPVAPTFSSPVPAPKIDAPASAKKEDSLPSLKIPTPTALNQKEPIPPPAPKFEPPKPLL